MIMLTRVEPFVKGLQKWASGQFGEILFLPCHSEASRTGEESASQAKQQIPRVKTALDFITTTAP